MLDRVKTAGLLTIPVFIILITGLVLFRSTAVFEPPFLLAVLNTVFLGVIPFFIAYIAYKTYRINGSSGVLLLGAGMLVFGFGSIAAGWLNSIPGELNITLTVHNTSACIGAGLALPAVLLALAGAGYGARKPGPTLPVLVYGGLVAFVAILAAAAAQGLIPPFSLPGTGVTGLRQAVLNNAAGMYTLAGVLFFFLYWRKRDDFYFWLSLGLGLVGIGLFAVLIQPSVGSFIGWAGRSAQYLGACFALVAILGVRQNARQAGISLPDLFGTFFGSEAATNAILAAAQESVWLFGTDGTILMANPTALHRLGGRSNTEVIGHPYSEFMSPALAQARRAQLDKVIRTKAPVRFEDVRDGISFDHSFYPVFDEGGRVVSIAAFSRDVTDLRRVDAALKENEAVLRSFFDSPGVMRGIVEVIADDDVRHITDNLATASFLCLKPEDMWNKKASELGEPPELIRTMVRHYRECQHLNTPVRFEYTEKRGERKVWLQATVSYLGTLPGGYPRFTYVILDISREKEAEAALARANEQIAIDRNRLEAIVGATPSAVVLVEASTGTFLYLNPRARTLYGTDYTGSDLKAHMAKVHALRPDGTPYPLEEMPVSQSLKSGKEIHNMEMVIERPDGVRLPVLVSSAPIFDARGTITTAVVSFNDITGQKRMEEALRESEERMRFALETSNTGAWDLDLTDHTAYRSQDHDRIFGYDTLLPAWTYEIFLDHVLPEDRPGVDAAFHHATDTGGDWNFECRIRRVDGEIRWIQAAGRHRPGAAGRMSRMAGIVQDITGRKQAEIALLKARDELEIRVQERTAELNDAIDALDTERHRLYDVLETLPVYVCLLDKDYRMPFANRYFREAFGDPGKQRCHEALFNRTEPCEICESYTVMKTRAPHHWFWTGPNGRDYDIHDYPFTDADGSFMILEMGIDITDRKKAEEERSVLASIVENSDDAIIGKSLDGVIVSWNTGAEKMYGYSALEATGSNISGLLPPGREDDLRDILELIQKGTPVHSYETVRMRKDGKSIQVSLTISPIRDRNGTLMGASTIARDISEWKNAEEAVKKANAYNRSLIEASLDPLVTISPGGTISDVNEATIRVTGFSREELVGTDFSDYFTEPEKAKAGYETVFRDGVVTDYALEIRHRNGQVIPVLYNATVYHDEAGNVTGVFAAARDITERRKAEEALRSSFSLLEKRVRDRTADLAEANALLRTRIVERIQAEEALRETSEYLEKLITHANAPIIVWDREFRITRFNHAAEILTGRTAEDVIDQRIEVIFPAKFVHAVMDLIRRTMTGEQLNVVEIPVLHRSGEVRVVLWNSANLYGPDGKTIESTIAQGQDITVRKRAEAELLRKNEELIALNQELIATQGELQRNVDELHRSEEALRKNESDLREALTEKEVLLAEIHHRVKNNLTAFISLLSLEGSYDESPAGRALKKDLQNRARSMALIHETLYRTGRYSSVDMGMYLSTLIEQIAVSYDPERVVQVVVSGDGVSIDLGRATPCGLIVNELVTNSFKYAFPGDFDCGKARSATCTITAGIREERDTYLMTIRDNGIGLPAGFDARTARSLGLKLVNFLAKHQLRATVSVRSEQGTEFELRFPVSQQQRKEP
jgi:PAS domain S-box-containing protein